MVPDQYLTFPSFLTHLRSLTLRISKTTGQQLVHLRVTQKQNQHVLIANFWVSLFAVTFCVHHEVKV
jgi:hypothetical protein